ncbi:MAG: DUF4136 domain-containing protein [Ekhidna sp.]|uniref:DUF4136 domain-containing protein n=1 Tax=Ekhidna sp. TaxID=2608089 RepID=UPI0032984847
MNKWLILLIPFLLCCSPKVVSYVNEKAAFKNYETFRIVSAKAESTNVTPENTQIFDLIKENILNQMERREYQLSNISPDLTLRYEVTSSARVETNTNRPSAFYPSYRIYSRTIYESIILIELINENKKLVWQGSYDLRQEKKEKKASRAIEKAVGHIFTTFPYKARSNQTFDELKTLEKKTKNKK